MRVRRVHEKAKRKSTSRVAFTWRTRTRMENEAAARAAAGASRGGENFVVDAHVHVWLMQDEESASSQSASPQFVAFAAGKEPEVAASPALLLKQMDEAGIDGALIVQPINYGFDHTFVTRTIAAQPDRFAGCLLANPHDEDASELRNLAATGHYHAVRFNPYLFDAAAGGMACPAGRTLYKACGELGLAVGVMAFHGIESLVPQIEALCECSPSTLMMLDHFGFCGRGDTPASPSPDPVWADWEIVVELARRFEQIYVKLSAFDRQPRFLTPDDTSDKYLGIRELIGDAISQIGSDRLIYGTDFPFVNDAGNIGYVEAKQLVERACKEAGLTAEAKDLVIGGNLRRILPRAFQPQDQ